MEIKPNTITLSMTVFKLRAYRKQGKTFNLKNFSNYRKQRQDYFLFVWKKGLPYSGPLEHCLTTLL